MAAEDGEELPLRENGDTLGPDKPALGNSQAGVLELSTLITNPGLKRAESSDVLNLTLHQVGLLVTHKVSLKH